MGGDEQSNGPSAAAGVKTGPGFSPLFVAPSPEELNRWLPQFEVIELIGQGGMGAVYKARQPRLDRFVAIKLLPAQIGDDPHAFAERFEREARAMAQLNHPNIVTVHDFGETEDGHRYIVMEYVHGTDLHAAIASGSLSPAHILAWVPQICAALEYAHSRNLVHRDIKPANILISEEGQVKVGDFGLAKIVGSSRDLSLTQSQVSMGTPDYAAPEALRAGADVDQRADIYSFGVVLYQMLTGVIPRGAWKAPSAIRPMDPRLDRVVVKALQPDPEHRYQRMEQVSQAFDDLRRNPVPPADAQKPAVRPGPSTPVEPKERMHPALVAGIAMGSVVMVVGIILLVAAKYMAPVTSPVTGAPPPPKIRKAADVQPERKGDGPRSGIPNRPAAPPANPAARVAPRPEPVPEPDGWVRLLAAEEAGVNGLGLGWSFVPASGSYRHRGPLADGVLSEPDPLLLVPAPPAGGYEVRFEVVPGSSGLPLEVRLPVQGGTAHLLFGAAGSAGEERCYGVVSTASHPDPEDPGNPSRRTFVLSSGEVARVVVRVVGKGGRTGVEATGNGLLAASWVGEPSGLAVPGNSNGGARRLIAIRSSGTTELRTVAFRPLPADSWLVHEAAAESPGPVALLTRPEMVVSAPEPMPLPAPDPVEAALSGLRTRLTEVRARYEGLEGELAVSRYERDLASLREKYQAALNRSLMPEGGLPVQLSVEAALQRELGRVRDREPIEDSDPPEMPETVRKLREVFRKEWRTLEEQLRLATAPILREHLSVLLTMAAEASWQAPEMVSALELVRAEARRVEARLLVIAPSADGAADPSAGTPSPAPAVVPAPFASPGVTLAREPFPPVRPELRGTVVLQPRNPGQEIPRPILDVPGGLGGRLVDLAAGESLVVGLKSTGRVVCWGEGIENGVRAEIESITRVARVAVAQRGAAGQVALLREDGTVEVRPFGPMASRVPGEIARQPEFKDVVAVSVTPLGGLALQSGGSLVPWGVFSLLPGLPEDVRQLRRAGSGVLALVGAGTPVFLTPSPVVDGWSDLPPVRDIRGGTQEEPGAVVQLADGTLRATGSFAAHADALQALVAKGGLTSFEAGYKGFAVRGLDGAWTFFGQDLDAGLGEAFAGCSKVILSEQFVVGLRPE